MQLGLASAAQCQLRKNLPVLPGQGAPKPLTTRDMDPVSGRLNWPDALQDASFSDQREAARAPVCQMGHVRRADFTEQKQLRETLNGMYTDIKGQIAQLPPQNYVAAKAFLQSLLFATTKTTL